jgi:glycosyltransferase involved in cell wall biosynthesis
VNKELNQICSFDSQNNNQIGAIVAFAGARDNYQLPVALHEERLLDAFVTDVYHKFSKSTPLLSGKIKSLALRRYCKDLEGATVLTPKLSLAATLLGRFYKDQYFSLLKDKSLGRRAAEVALKKDAALFVYSYYAHSAFSYNRQILPFRFIFQLHPHPIEVRRILAEEIELTPEAKFSLIQEYELGLPQSQFEQLSREPHLANGWVVASSFSASTLTAQGIPQEKIHIVPYGVDFSQFPQRKQMPVFDKPLRVIFVGSMVQRKGLSYLLQAVRLLKSQNIEIVLCGRGVRDQQLISQYKDLNISIKTNLSRSDLVQEIHQSDLMIFPSLAEGFAHVILEVMSCGVPIIATPHTCAPDIMEDGRQGFIVPIRSSQVIAEKLEWAIYNRESLYEMGVSAAAQARLFSWSRFRDGIRQAYRAMLMDVDVNSI